MAGVGWQGSDVRTAVAEGAQPAECVVAAAGGAADRAEGPGVAAVVAAAATNTKKTPSPATVPEKWREGCGRATAGATADVAAPPPAEIVLSAAGTAAVVAAAASDAKTSPAPSREADTLRGGGGLAAGCATTDVEVPPDTKRSAVKEAVAAGPERLRPAAGNPAATPPSPACTSRSAR